MNVQYYFHGRCEYEGATMAAQYVDSCNVVCTVTDLTIPGNALLRLSLDGGTVYGGDKLFHIFGSPHMVGREGGSWC